MEEIRVKDITITSGDSSLTIVDDARPDSSIVLDTSILPEIIQFLNSHRPDPSENRTGFRVPVASLCEETRSGFSATIEADGQSIEYAAFDFSITGILIEDSRLRLIVDQTVSMALRYKEHSATIDAVVVRCEKERTCFHFPDTLTDGELDPPDDLMRLYRALEMDWLRERVS